MANHCHPAILVVKFGMTITTDALSVVAIDCYICKIQCIHGLVGEDKEHCLAALDSYRLPDAV